MQEANIVMRTCKCSFAEYREEIGGEDVNESSKIEIVMPFVENPENRLNQHFCPENEGQSNIPLISRTDNQRSESKIEPILDLKNKPEEKAEEGECKKLCPGKMLFSSGETNIPIQDRERYKKAKRSYCMCGCT